MTRILNLRLIIAIFTVLVLILAVILSQSKYLTEIRALFSSSEPAGVHLSSHPTFKSLNMTSRTPVYFLGHGGPNIMYQNDHPAYTKLQEIGNEITQKVKPKAIVVFSAHWQGEPNVIEINTSEDTDLIYDFYGFPSHYYTETYPNKGSPEIATKVINALTKAGIKSQPRRRGLDHGVWASFIVAFNPKTNPLQIPVVQVSLFATEDPAQHYALGRAVSSLREENIQIIVSGMAVHNLRDIRFGFGTVRPYVKPFDEALREAVEADPEEREGKMTALLWRTDARPAHPTFEHLLPIHVGAGAAGSDLGKRLWTLVEGSMSWAQFRFGDVPALP